MTNARFPHEQGHTEPFFRFSRSDIIIGFSNDGCSDVAFKVTVRKTYVWSLDLSDLTTPYRWCIQCLVSFTSRCAIPWSTSSSCQALAPSTTMTSAYGLSAGTVRTSALRAVPWLHEHPERFAVEADGPLCIPVWRRTSTDPVQLEILFLTTLLNCNIVAQISWSIIDRNSLRTVTVKGDRAVSLRLCRS